MPSVDRFQKAHQLLCCKHRSTEERNLASVKYLSYCCMNLESVIGNEENGQRFRADFPPAKR